jgi:hypothetical protein
MGFLRDFRLTMFNNKLKALAQGHPRRRPNHPQWSDIQTIGILAAIEEPTDLASLKIGMNRLAKEGLVLHFLNARKKNKKEPLPDECFDKDRTDWRFLPKDPKAGEFCNKPLDLLINLDQQGEKSLLYIVAHSKARLKIGFEKSTLAPWADISLQLKTKELKSVEKLQKVINFIKTINKRDEPVHI